MKGLIILDGPDGAGKTTLANEIVRQTGGHYMHLTYRFKEKMFTYHLANLHRAVKMSAHKVVVIDRLWMSEICYANAYRNGSKWPLMFRMLERIILKHAGIEVMCLPKDLERHLEEFKRLRTEREEMYTTIAPVVLEYHKLWDKVKDWPHMRRYDVHTAVDNPGFMENYVDDLLKQLEAWRDEQLAEGLDPTYYNLGGHISSANFLLVGSSHHQRNENWYPFVHYGQGPLLIAQVLEDLGLPEHELLWTSYCLDPTIARKVVPTYEIQPLSLGRADYNQWIADYGGHDKMHSVPRQANGLTKVLTMTLLNNISQMHDPDHSFRVNGYKSYMCDLGGYLLRKTAYGRTLT